MGEIRSLKHQARRILVVRSPARRRATEVQPRRLVALVREDGEHMDVRLFRGFAAPWGMSQRIRREWVLRDATEREAAAGMVLDP